MKKIVLFLVLSLCLPHCFSAQTKPQPQKVFAASYDYVNDFEKILNSNQIITLNKILKSSEKKSGKIIVVTISSIKPYTSVPEYAYYLENYLSDNLKLKPTFLIVLSKELRQIQLQSSHQMRTQLTEEETKSIINNFAIPEFKKDDYYKGLENAVTQIIKKMH